MENKIIPYTEKEKLPLAALVDKFNIVENKKTDASTIQMKQEEWKKIANEYNAQGDVINIRRTPSQLKKLWNNLKQRKRKSTTQIKYARLITGGGPPPTEEIDPVMEAVDIAAPHMDVMLECPWDSTAQFMINEQDQSNGIKLIEVPTVVSCTSAAHSKNTTSAEVPEASHSNNILAEVPKEVSFASGTTSSTPSKPRNRSFLENESNLRIRKIKESTEQQYELHKIRIKIEEEQLKKILAERRKMEAEEELDKLKLLMYKKEHNL